MSEIGPDTTLRTMFVNIEAVVAILESNAKVERQMYPIILNLAGKPCVVAGGGKVAFLKIKALLEAQAGITVVSPAIIPEIEQLQAAGKLNIHRKDIAFEDYKDAFLIIAATDDHKVNQHIYESVKDWKLVNVVSDSETGNFHVPATLTRGRLQISVATGGASPLLAKKIRDELQERFDDSYETYLDFLYEARMALKRVDLPKEKKRALLHDILDDKYITSPEHRDRFLAALNRYLHDE